MIVPRDNKGIEVRNPYRSPCADNSIPVQVFCAKTNKIIGTFFSVGKALRELTGFDRNGNKSKMVYSCKKNGKPRTFKLRDGTRAYMKPLTDYRIA